MHDDDVPPSQFDTSHFASIKTMAIKKRYFCHFEGVNRSDGGLLRSAFRIIYTSLALPFGSSMLQDISRMPKLHLLFEYSNQEIRQSRVNYL